MGLGSCLHLPFWGSAIVFNYFLMRLLKYREWLAQPLIVHPEYFLGCYPKYPTCYYIRKTTEAVTSMLFVMCPGQENQTWSTLRKAPILLESPNPGSSPKRKSFNNYSMIMNQRQTKRQILSLFANDFSCAEPQQMIPRLLKWPIDQTWHCLLYTSPSPRDRTRSRMPSSA